MTNADKSSAITIDCLGRLSHLVPDAIKNTQTLDNLGITAELQKVLPGLLSRSALENSLSLRASNLSKSIKPGATVADLISAVSTSAQQLPARKAVLARGIAGKYSALDAAEDVAVVIGRFKNVSPASVAASDKLDRWHFSALEKRALAQSLNLFYKNVKHLTMAPWIHPKETGAAKIVANLISIVISHNPH